MFSALADLQSELGHHGEAKRFEETAIRYEYASGTPENRAISHLRLADYLIRLGGDWRNVLAHRLSAALIWAATGSGQLADTISVLATDLARAGQAEASLPEDFASLCATVEQVPGVRFRELMERLLPGEDRLNQALRDIVAEATKSPASWSGVFSCGRESFSLVMVGEGRPSTPFGPRERQGVDPRPSPRMTASIDALQTSLEPAPVRDIVGGGRQ